MTRKAVVLSISVPCKRKKAKKLPEYYKSKRVFERRLVASIQLLNLKGEFLFFEKHFAIPIFKF